MRNNSEEYEIYEYAKDVISFAQQYEQIKISNQHEQGQQDQSKSFTFPINIADTIFHLQRYIDNNYKCKELISIPNFLYSFTMLTNYKYNVHTSQKEQEQALQVRNRSRCCLNSIQWHGDKYEQAELINAEYGKVLIISISTAGGDGEQINENIWWGLNFISNFFISLYQGRNFYPKLPTLPALAKTCMEQIEEEGGIEEIESQLINNNKGSIQYYNKDCANDAKRWILKCYVNKNET